MILSYLLWPLASLMKTPPLRVAILSAWRRSVLPCCKLMDLFSTRLEFPIHSLWPAAEVLPQPSYVMSLCKSAIVDFYFGLPHITHTVYMVNKCIRLFPKLQGNMCLLLNNMHLIMKAKLTTSPNCDACLVARVT